MTTIDIAYLRETIQLTPGRAAFVVERIARKLTDDERTRVEAPLVRAREAASTAVALASARRKLDDKTYGEAARARDAAVDDVLGAMDAQLGSLERVHAGETEAGARVRRLRTLFFPMGLASVSGAAYPEELAQVQHLLARAAEPAHAADVARVPGLSELLDLLATRIRELDAVLDRAPRTAPSYREARAAMATADRRLMELVMSVYLLHPGDEEAPVRRRSEILEAYDTLLENQRARLRRRMSADDVDPKTGAPLDPTTPTVLA